MGKFWKEHTALRICMTALLFLAGAIATIKGWQMTGTLAGLGVMLVGLVLLLAALGLYNTTYKY